MGTTIDSPWLRFKAHAIPKDRGEQVVSDNLQAHDVAAPLFRAGVLIAGLTERIVYRSSDAARPYHSLTLLLQGRMTFTFEGRTHLLEPGQLACCPAGMPFRRSADETPSWWLYFDIEALPDWEPIRTHGPYVRPYGAAALLFLLLRDVLDAKASHTPAASAHAWECSRQLVHMLRNEMALAGWRRSPHGLALQQLCAEVDASPGQPWDRCEMAARLNLSVRQMTQVVRDTLGVSPHELVVRRRLNFAIDRLINTECPIKAIAAEAGYASLHAFTRLFTRHVGLPPGTYRNRFGNP